MSFLSVVPDAVAAASASLKDLGSALRGATATAAAHTTTIPAPAADEVSAAIAAVFGTNAQEFQLVSAKAAAFHDEFTKLLSGGAAQYLNAEIANAQQTLTNTVNTPAAALSGQPLAAAAATANPNYTYSFGPLTIWGTGGGDLINGTYTATWGLTGPFGPLYIGSQSWTTSSGVVQFNAPTDVSPLLGLAVDALGPYVTGGYSLVNSANAFTTAVNGGNILGAAGALLFAPVDFTGAVLFGHQSVLLPSGASDIPPYAVNSIPFGGLFAPLEPGTTTVPQSTWFNPYSGATVTVLPSQHSFQGTEFGGLFPGLLNLIGINL